MSPEQAWFEDDRFWETMAGQLFHPQRWEKVPEEIDQVLALLAVEPPARILDLCCGPGRHSLELARRGFAVTGVDRTRSYLEQARTSAAKDDLAITFVQEDMRRFAAVEEFDAVINIFTSFGYFNDPADDARVLAQVHAALKPGGKVLMEMMGKEILSRIFRPRDWLPTEDDSIFLQERTVSEDWSWIDNRWILIENGERKEFRVAHRLYSAVELKDLLVATGFEACCAFGTLAGDPYDQTAKRLVVRAQKPTH